MTKYNRFQDIPKFIQGGSYHVDLGWRYFPEWIKRQQEGAGLELNPDFQRGHVWTEDKQVAYVEFCLRGGRGANEIYFNCPDWPEAVTKGMVMVDGLQRTTAVLRFMRDEVVVFGSRYSEFTDKLRIHEPTFSAHINNLPTRADVLRWYLELNSGGVVHTQEELDRVRILLATANKRSSEKGVTT